MSINYTTIATKVSTLLTKVGTPITLSRAGSAYATTTGVFQNIDITEDKTAGASRISRLNNQQSEVTIPAIATTPAPGDTLVGNGNTLKVIEVKPVKPALITISYLLVLQ